MSSCIQLCSRVIAALVCLSWLAFPAWAFNPPEDQDGPLSIRIDGPTAITEAGVPTVYRLIMQNRDAAPVTGFVRLSVVTGWRIQPEPPASILLPPESSTELPFTVIPNEHIHSAHYPVHAYITAHAGGIDRQLHAVLVIETQMSATQPAHIDVPWQTVPVHPGVELSLARRILARPVVTANIEATRVLPAGWQGSDTLTRASVEYLPSVYRGSARPAIGIHPPWSAGYTGSAWVEYQLTLPAETPILLRFSNAIRDTHHGEPPSDGVTFRVRAASIDMPDGEPGQILFERHTASKTWVDGEADLSSWAGQTIRLQLESHPGPANDTTCDQSFWGGPVIIAGIATPVDTSPPSRPCHALGAIMHADTQYAVSVQPGPRGMLDARFRFEHGAEAFGFDGFKISILDDDVASPASLHTLTDIEERFENGIYSVRHHFDTWAGPFILEADAQLHLGQVVVRFCLTQTPSDRPWLATRIEDIAAGPWTSHAHRVYAGVGNVLEEPEAFYLGFDGHQLASSFVGFDFPEASIVQTSATCPSGLEVDPAANRYSLHAAYHAVFSFIPAPNVWEAVKVWHGVDQRPASPGVERLAGRFAFDIWGGSVSGALDSLRRAYRYGLTDGVLVWHNWQRWGYDYRLPDIYPPNPAIGSVDDFRALAALCAEHRTLFALHDNYIDLYPDAEGFSYEKVAFNADGTPRRGWFNEGRKAQAYMWRPDLIRPEVERNLAMIREGIWPTAYFIDVWSSIAPQDYWTSDGRFIDRALSECVWGDTFARIRSALDGAPQISESGHDRLVGKLDGAQTNHLRADPNGGVFLSLIHI